jgi:hypothetical protein
MCPRLLRPDHERTIEAATTTMDSCEALWDIHYGRISAKYQADRAVVVVNGEKDETCRSATVQRLRRQ